MIQWAGACVKKWQLEDFKKEGRNKIIEMDADTGNAEEKMKKKTLKTKKTPKKKWVKNLLIDLLVDVIAALMYAFAAYNIAAPASFPLAGFTGIAMIFYKLFGWPIGLVTIVINVPFAILCYRLLGRRFFLRSLKTMVICYVFMDFVAPYLPLYQGEPVLAAFCIGILNGVAGGLIYMRGGSAGGLDFITLAIKAKKPYIKLGSIILASNAVIILGGAFFVKSGVDGIIYALIITLISSMVVNKVMYGINASQIALVVTGKPGEMTALVESEINRGMTLLKAEGGHTGDDKKVIMCACDNKELYRLREIVMDVDEEAFIITLESGGVIGSGFLDK